MAGVSFGGDLRRRSVLGPSPVDLFGGGADALAVALRRCPEDLATLQRDLIRTGVDILLAPTGATTAPALHRTGQAYRAAALTAAAVEISRDAVAATPKLGGPWVFGEVPALPGARDLEEALTHVERLVTSAIDGVWVDAIDSDTTRAVLRSAAAHRLPAVVEVDEERLELAEVLGQEPIALIVVRGAVPHALETALAALRVRFEHVPFGARLAPAATLAASDAAAIVQAWWALPHDGLVALGVGGAHAQTALGAAHG